MNIRTIASGALAVFIGCCLASCENDVVFTESQSVDKEGWLAADTLTLSPSINDIETTYDIYLWVRHTKEYDYSNIWLKVISDPLLTEDSTYLLDIPVADKAGQWLGHCSQSLCTVRVILKEDLQFQEASAFKVDVLQYMREANLTEVRDVGIEVVEHID